MKDEDAKLKQYLLGSLAQPETEEIDLQLISDDSLEEKLHWAESELMEDYLDKALSPPEVALFEKNFLVSPERKSQLKQILLLRNYAQRGALKTTSEPICEKSSETFTERLKRFCSLNIQPASIFVLIVIGLLVGTIVYYRAYQLTPLEKEFAELNRADLSNLSEYQNLTNVNLTFGTFRDAGGANKLSANALSNTILFRLALPFVANLGDKFTVEINKEEKIIFSRRGMPFYNNPNGNELRLLVPASALKKGEYQIRVEKEMANELAVNYNFIVQ